MYGKTSYVSRRAPSERDYGKYIWNGHVCNDLDAEHRNILRNNYNIFDVWKDLVCVEEGPVRKGP